MKNSRTITNRTLEREIFHAVEAIDLALLDVHVDIYNSFSADALVLRMSGFIWSEHLQDETVTLVAEYPATWWQHFKQRFYPEFAKRRWPVKMANINSSHTFRTVALLPDFKYNPPNGCGERFIVRTYADPERSFRKFTGKEE